MINQRQLNRAFEFALDLAKKYRSHISIITCVSNQIPDDPSFGKIGIKTTKAMKKSAENAISKLESKLKKSDISFKSEILEVASITEALISYAKLHRVDLIVMGSRGLGGFKKLLLGSVTNSVSQHSKCPILIIK